MGTIRKKLNWFYYIRDVIWKYPRSVEMFANRLYVYYRKTRPFSHIILLITFFSLIGSFTIIRAEDAIIINQSELIEGVVIGNQGRPKTVNPVLISDNPLETDLSAIIYQGLVRVTSDGDVEGVLAHDWKQLDEDGLQFEIMLKQDVYWHDGEKFNADDVISTFSILKSLGNRNYFTAAAEDYTIDRVDDYTVVVTSNVVLPTLFESLQWGVMPAHLISNANPSTFSTHSINKQPIGTGPFKLGRVEENEITLLANRQYHGGSVNLDTFTFRLFENADDAFNALQNGLIHMLANPQIEFVKTSSEIDNLSIVESNPLYPIYWAMYFNLRQDSSVAFLKEREVRQAISMGINKDEVITIAFEGYAEVAKGPIPETSWAYDDELERWEFNPESARVLLEEGGWVVGEDGIREKDGVRLSFKLSHLDSPDKTNIVGLITSHLNEIGVEVIPDPHSADDLRNAYVASRNFETVLYAVETTIDPDRLDFWHEDAILPPGRNISSYNSEDKRTFIDEGGEQAETSVVNISLQNGFSSLDRNRRNGFTVIDGEKSEVGLGYYKFQEVIHEDAPAVFLYHPKFVYITRIRVSNINLTDMGSAKDRFLSIEDWTIDI